jgi:hypothetical protein
VLVRLDGIFIVMNAMNKRYSEQAGHNKIIKGADDIRDEEKKDI